MIKAPKRRRKKGPRVKRPPKPPSEKFGPAYNDYRKRKKNADGHVVLGAYFVLYRELYGEEDPEWVGEKFVKPLYILTKMADGHCQGSYKPIIEYVENIMPLWAQQLKAGAEFPSSRPTFDILFARKKIWAQRFNLCRRWKS